MVTIRKLWATRSFGMEYKGEHGDRRKAKWVHIYRYPKDNNMLGAWASNVPESRVRSNSSWWRVAKLKLTPQLLLFINLTCKNQQYDSNQCNRVARLLLEYGKINKGSMIKYKRRK